MTIKIKLILKIKERGILMSTLMNTLVAKFNTYFFSWGFYYFSAGYFAANKIR